MMHSLPRLCVTLFALLAGALVNSATAQAEQLPISMMYSNSSIMGLPFDLISKGRWQPNPAARFVKLHLYFDHPVKLSSFEVIPCDKPFEHDITVFANFDEWLWKLDSNAEMPEPLDSGRAANKVKGTVDADASIRSLTFNFEQNKGFALCGIKLYDPAKKPLDLVVPRIIPGTADASSTLAPASAYSVMNLFDSRFESAWSSDKIASNVSLNFNFTEQQSITRLRIWGGYQRSPEHCIANSRPKLLRIDGENGYSVKINVKDVMGAQEIALPKPYSGKSLKITVEDSYHGKSYADLLISELRFGDSNGWFMLDPLPHIREGILANRQKFHDANLAAVLDDSLMHTDGESSDLYDRLRLRSDGSFYLSGMNGGVEAPPLNYFAIGSYEIKAVDPVKGMQLRLFGLYHESEAYGDCNGCGRDCNRPEAEKEKIFQELVWLKPDDTGKKFTFTPFSGKRIAKKAINFALE